MGHYFKVFNLDKKESITPHSFHDGAKLMEFACSSNGTLTGLAILLRRSSETGGGDFGWSVKGINHSDLIGSWAGDRIAIVGDYDDPAGSSIYFDSTYTDISDDVVELIRYDHYVNKSFEQYEEMKSRWG